MRLDNNQTKTTWFLHRFFEQHAYKSPNQIALVCENKTYSYIQLEHAANQFARYLKKLGIKKGDCIGVLLERSAEVYIVLLGILKAGAAYVPLDPEYPAERIHYILTDCDTKLLVTNIHLAIKLPTFSCKSLVLESTKDSIARESVTSIDPAEMMLDQADLCYIIYTSGSTGKPKGVQISHKNAANYIQAASLAYQIQSSDKVYQGFSIAFDASVEEIWLCLANGATLVAGTDKALRSGAGLIDFLAYHAVTVLSCVPTLLAILEPPIQNLRLLILGGEVCTADLVKRWSSSGLRILNTYGPTEATVVATYSECLPEKPVTIGKPLPNYEVIIVDEHLNPVAAGVEGELCISGDCLAHGYVNRPDLNETKFINLPTLNNKRIYRTGDLCRMSDDGNIHFVGRIDEQVKLRGFRIELTEIETVIKEFPAIANTVVSMQELSPGVQSLIAYVVPNQKSELCFEKLAEFLHDRLPDYMMPNHFEILAEMPLLASGKINRKNLPKPQFSQKKVKKEFIPATTEVEKKISQIWQELFNHNPISIHDDFFYDLNGHSLLAAKAVSTLRKLPGLENISMLDLYKNSTVAKLAEKFAHCLESNNLKQEKSRSNKTSEEKICQNRRGWRYYLCAAGQLFGGVFQFALRSWELLLVYLVLFIFEIGKFPIFLGIVLLVIGLPLTTMIIVVLMKWLLLGRVKPGQYRLWGWFYFRWWLVTSMQRTFAHLTDLIGSPFIIIYYRAMGARIGRNCHINTALIVSCDLLTIGDNTSIGYDSSLLGYTVENGWLKVGSITIGNECYIGSRSAISINTVMEDGAVLEDLSMLPRNQCITKDKHYYGSPARERENETERLIVKPKSFVNSSNLNTTWFAVIQLLGLVFLTIIYYLSYLPGLLIIDHFYQNHAFLKSIFIGAPLGGAVSILLVGALIIVVKKLVVGKIKAGQYKIRSIFFIRTWIVERLLNNQSLQVLSDSLYFPVFLRFIGAKIGKRVESGDLPFLTPDLLTMDDESFNASTILIGVPRVYGGYVTYGSVTIDKRGFIGNLSLLPINTEIGEGTLLGCLSIPPATQKAKQPNTSWFGTPAMFLPKREVFAGFSDKHTYHPTKILYFTRLCIEFIRIISPSILTFMSLVAIFLSIDYLYAHFSLLSIILLFPLFDIAILFAFGGFVILLKWMLVGKLKPAVKPIWCVFIWKYDLIEHLIDEFVKPVILTPLYGTPFVAFFYRLLGAKIGKGVFIDVQEFAEYDLIKVDDDVALNQGSILQTHLYEDRIFKMANIHIEKGCNVGTLSIVLYDTVMEQHSTLGNLSLLMKGETLPAYSVWSGVPAQAADMMDPLPEVVKEPVGAITAADTDPDSLIYSIELKTNKI